MRHNSAPWTRHAARYPVKPNLLRAVVAAYRDITPRLRYADWLDARGWIEWADFIRRPMT